MLCCYRVFRVVRGHRFDSRFCRHCPADKARAGLFLIVVTAVVIGRRITQCDIRTTKQACTQERILRMLTLKLVCSEKYP